jgi:hypothetical protein
VVDFFSQLGGNYISTFYKDLRFFGILKILKVLKLGSMVQKMNVETTLKTTLLLFKLIIYMFIWVHFMACFWWYTTIKNVDKVD